MFRVQFLILIVSCWVTVGYATMITRKNPVVLKVFKLTNGTTALPGRTKPLFIQETLNLSQGKVFKFDIEKWRDIISSGLFQNLTVNSVHTEEGVYLNITGFETPSLSLSPEATFTASLDNPEILGGVSWKDSNFLGMGDKIALSIFKKESLEEGMQHSEPTLKLKWTEAGIGKKSKISVSHEEDNSFEYFSEVFSRPLYSLYSQFKDNNTMNIYHDRNNVRLSTTTVELSTIIPPEQLEKYSLGRSLYSVRYGLQPFIRTVASLSRSYKEGAGSASDEVAATIGDSCRGIGGQQLMSRAIGGRKFLECGFKNGATLRSWYEAGCVVSRPASASSGRFHQVGLAVNLPTLTLSWLRNIASTRKTIPTSSHNENAQISKQEQRSGFNHSGNRPDKGIGNKRSIGQATNILPTTAATAGERVDRPMTMLSAWQNKLSSAFRNAELVGKVKLHGISSWGSGCVPAQHQASLSSPQLVRCLPSHSDYPSSAVRSSGSSSSEGNESGPSAIATSTEEMGNTGILKRAQNLLSIQRDLYVKGLLPASGIVGVFADTGLFHRPVECSADSAGITGAGRQCIESFLTAGVSLRVLGFRVDYGAQILHKKKMATPQVHFGFDLGD